MEKFVSLKNVSKIYQMGEVEIRAVDGINFDIEKGEFVVIVGPSGAGKTTVLNILGGMDTATTGQVWVDGRDIAKYNQKQLTGYRRDDIVSEIEPPITITHPFQNCNEKISCTRTNIFNIRTAVYRNLSEDVHENML